MGKTPHLRDAAKDRTESMEYSLVLGLIAVASCAVLGSVGVRAMAEWQSVNSSMDGGRQAVVVGR